MIRYLIIDDESVAHEIIKGYANQLPNMKFVKSCYDALEALEYLSDHHVDLVFLDLNMPKLKGFDFLRTLKNPPKVIITTAYQEYALEGYELNVIDYLLKPISFERFLTAVNKVASEAPVQKVEEYVDKPVHSETIFLKSENKHIQVAVDTILFLEAAGNYTKVITSEDNIITRLKISELLSRLPEGEFIQVHKSFVIGTRNIRNIEGNRIKIADTYIPIGKLYKQNVLKLLDK